MYTKLRDYVRGKISEMFDCQECALSDHQANHLHDIETYIDELEAGSMKKPVVRTEAQLDLAVKCLSESECREALKQIATQWFVESDGTLNRDKELGSDQLEAVTQTLSSRGIYPTA